MNMKCLVCEGKHDRYFFKNTLKNTQKCKVIP